MKKTVRLLSAALALALTIACFAGCGSDGAIALRSDGNFKKWFSAEKKDGLSAQDQAGTYYFQLKSNITVTEVGTISGGHTVVIDLNGHTISGKENQVFSVSGGGSLTLKNGKVTSAGADADGGVVAIADSGSALVLEDVELSNTDDSTIGRRRYGGVVHVFATGEEPATITVKGDSVINGSASGKRDCGGTVSLMGNSQLHVLGGTIQNGVAATGGNIYMDERAKLFMSGGTVSGGKTTNQSALAGDGGNIALCGKAQIHLYGGQIAGGEALRNGGNIFLSCTDKENNAGFYQYGGTVADGKAKDMGGNIYAVEKASCVRIYGGEVRLGQAHFGGNISLQAAALDMRGGKLTGAEESTDISSGGNIYATQSVLALYDGSISAGWTSGAGGSIYAENVVMDIYGGSITGGKTECVGVDFGGGNLYVGGASVLNMYGGEISGGVGNCLFQEKSASAPNVMIDDTTIMQMFGGVIKDGYISGTILRTGCLYVHGRNAGDNCIFHMYGGAMENGALDGLDSVRGMTVAAYQMPENDGLAVIRLFDGEQRYTGPATNKNKMYTIYGNRGFNLILFDAKKYEGLYASAETCNDATHNTKVEDVAATCVIQGYTKYHCDTCGDWCKITAAATGHTEVATQVEATGGVPAHTRHSCSACGNVRYVLDGEE